MLTKARLSLADALRTIRKERGLTLAELAARSGVPRTTLSKVENGKASLTYEKLVQVGDGLGVDIDRLFAAPGGEAATAPAAQARRRAVTRFDEVLSVESANYVNAYLSSDILRRRAHPIVSTARARTLEEFGEWVRHDGEEFAFVLEGEILFCCEDYAPSRLRSGDSIYFDSAMGHAYLAALDTPCRMVVICVRG